MVNLIYFRTYINIMFEIPTHNKKSVIYSLSMTISWKTDLDSGDSDGASLADSLWLGSQSRAGKWRPGPDTWRPERRRGTMHSGQAPDPLRNSRSTQDSHKVWPQTLTISLSDGFRYLVVLHRGHAWSSMATAVCLS